MDNNDLPKLSRLPIRADKEPTDPEIWFPQWRCFCCHDYGTVATHLIQLVIEDYDSFRDKSVVCQRCDAGNGLLNSDNYDSRFSRGLCDRLDRIERNNWTETVKSKQQRILDLKDLTKKLSMPGSRDRTENDNREVQMQKAEIEAIPHEKWIAMSNRYLGGHADEYCNEV